MIYIAPKLGPYYVKVPGRAVGAVGNETPRVRGRRARRPPEYPRIPH